MADIHDDDARRQAGLQAQRRQTFAIQRDRRIAVPQAQPRQRIRSGPGLPGLADEAREIEAGHRLPRHRRAGGQAQRLYTQHAQRHRRIAGKAEAAFQHRRHLPARPPQPDVDVLVQVRALPRQPLRVHRTRQYRAGARIVLPRLRVQGLHAAP